MEDSDVKIHPQVRLRFIGNAPLFGPGPVRLLKETERCGNVRSACENSGFSYSKGWTILKRCEEDLGYRLIERQAGGQSGGMAHVTERGLKLIEVYERLEAELSELAESRFELLMEEQGLPIESIKRASE